MPDPDNIPYVKTVKRLLDINEVGDVPVIGGLWNAGNTVIDFFESECNPDWNVYAETLFPAVGEAVLVLVSFGLDDVLRGYLRPAGGRGFGGLGRASRRKRKLSRAEKALGKLEGGIPEIGEEIGKHLPGAEVIKARKVGSAERFLWKVDGLAQRGLWFWMIADVLDDLTVNWTTGLYSSEDCRGLEVGGMERSEPSAGLPGGVAFTSVNLTNVDQDWGNITHTMNFVHLDEGQHGHLTFFAKFERYNVEPARVRLAITGPGGIVLSTSGPANPNPTEPGYEMAATSSIHGPGFFSWGAQCLDGHATLIEPTAVCIIEGGPP